MDLILRFTLVQSVLAIFYICCGAIRYKPFEIIRHPLDPLSPSEIHLTSVVIRQHNSSSTWIFNRISLQEPEKAKLLPFFLRNELPAHSSVPRKAFAVILDSKTFSGVEVIVNLSERRVVSWTDLSGKLQPATNRPDRNLAENLVKDDFGVQERCRGLGWSNMSLVAADVWPVGYIGDIPNQRHLNPENRLVQSFFYGKMFWDDNEYAHPFDFVAIVDLKNRKVVSIEDLPTRDNNENSSAPNSVPRTLANYDYKLLGGQEFLRKNLKPVKITQPKGASFSFRGNLIKWQKFQFRIGFNEREGLIIHHVGYNDDNNDNCDKKQNQRFRPLFYRLSLSETFIPYADSRTPFQRKGAYDMGELDIGISVNELNSDEYCLGENVKFFDAFINDPHGEPLRLKRAVCVFEEDNGILWKHTDYRTGKSTTVRSQRLNVAFMATIGNYDYIFTWHFYQDATIQYEVRLTGILSTNLAAPNNIASSHGTMVGEQVNAQNHQHVFAVRIDADVDGNHNTVGTLDVVADNFDNNDKDDPYGKSFTAKLTKFHTTGESRTHGSHLTSRTWLMMSSNNTNRYSNTPTSYKLIPKHHARFLVLPDSPLYPKAEFSDYDVWVTPYVDGQLYAGGRYLNNSGLPEWTRDAGDKNIENSDVVLWHIFRVDHAPRVEDYPVMHNEAAGFTLKPFNFFLQNPSLDVLPTSN